MAQQGNRILVVEDEAIIALELEALLSQASYEVTTCSSLESGLRQAGESAFDAAVLDVNLRGQMSYPIADALAARNIPFVLVSGYDLDIVPCPHRRRPFVGKPYMSQKLLATLSDAINRSQPLATSAA